MIRDDEAARARELEREEVARRLAILGRLWKRWKRPLSADKLEAAFIATLEVPMVELERACWVVLEMPAAPRSSVRASLLEAVAVVVELRERAKNRGLAADSSQQIRANRSRRMLASGRQSGRPGQRRNEMSKAKKNAVVGEVCFYGTREVRFGWLATASNGARLGDGELRNGSLTDALLEAVFELRRHAGNVGLVRVYAPGGFACATTRIDRPGYVGDLAWTAAPVYQIGVEALLEAARKQDADDRAAQQEVADADVAAELREAQAREDGPRAGYYADAEGGAS